MDYYLWKKLHIYVEGLETFTHQILKKHFLCASTLSGTENTIYREDTEYTKK